MKVRRRGALEPGLRLSRPALATALGRLGLAGLVVAAAAGARGAETLSAYLRLAEMYRGGAHAAALRQLRAWEPRHTEEAAEGLLDAWLDLRVEEADFVRLAQASVLMHAELSLATAEVGDPVEHGRQVMTMRRLLRALHGRERSGAPAVPGALPARDLYVAVAALQLVVGAVPQANTLLVEFLAAELGRPVRLRDDFALAEYPPDEIGLTGSFQVDGLVARQLTEGERDPRLLLLAGCAQESLALQIRQSNLDDRGPRTRGALRRAEAFLRAAHDSAPESVEIRLRLGWLLVQRGELEQARPLLEAVTESSGDSVQGYLAWLFLGRLREAAGEPGAALDAFERAVALNPGAPAGRLALARAREQSSGYGAASEILRPFLTQAGATGPGPGPWAHYATGPEELRLRPFEQLRERVRLR